jgi:acetoin:2,6-dichlorophenolindophenol oxidoreductase subunit alpha
VADTYRYFGHHVGDPLNYRSREEVDEWRKNDPIERFQQVLVDRGMLTDSDAERIREEVVAEVERAIDFAKESPVPSPESLMEDIYA